MISNKKKSSGINLLVNQDNINFFWISNRINTLEENRKKRFKLIYPILNKTNDRLAIIIQIKLNVYLCIKLNVYH